MTAQAAYGALFRRAYSLLHGGTPEEGAWAPQRQPEEDLEDFLARTRHHALVPLREELEATPPPSPLAEAHRLLLEAINCALEADAALAAQIQAYSRGDYRSSLEHSQRAIQLAQRAVELDRALIRALWQAEEWAPGTLAALGLRAVLPREDDKGAAEDEQYE